MSSIKKKNSNLEAARSRMYHDLIFECAERVFAEKGFDECTMQDVAAEAGISLKTLYTAFPGKNEIYAEIQAVRGIAFLDRVRGGAADGSALEKLEAGLRAFVAFLVEHDAYRRILLREGHAWGLDPTTENTREHWRAGVNHVAAVLRQGMDEGVFHDGDAELLAASVTAVMQVQLAGRLFRAGNQANAAEIAEGTLVVLRRMLCVDPDAPNKQTLAAAS
jgi:AcrR family transcriptional regulator